MRKELKELQGESAMRQKMGLFAMEIID
jgi:hypothetical protein